MTCGETTLSQCGVKETQSALLAEMRGFHPEPGRLAFWWFGQMGFGLRMGGSLLFVDAFLSPHPRRCVAPAVDADAAASADYVLGTHDHVDHIDREAWKRIASASAGTCFIVPECYRGEIAAQLGVEPERVLGVDEGRPLRLGRLLVRAIPSAHEFLDEDPHTGLHPHLGYVLEADGRRIYHAGDTCLYEGMQAKLRAFGHFDAMFVPINGRDGVRYRRGTIGNLTEQEAVDLVGAIQPELAVPGHYEMFAGNPGDPALFADYLEAKYPGIRWWIGDHFKRVDL